jgi:hypothetical protein
MEMVIFHSGTNGLFRNNNKYHDTNSGPYFFFGFLPNSSLARYSFLLFYSTDTGGMLLYVPPGVWLTGPFNLTSHMTLFLARGATIKATQVSSSPPFFYVRLRVGKCEEEEPISFYFVPFVLVLCFVFI